MNRGEWDLVEEYAERDPLMVPPSQGCEEVSSESRGSGSSGCAPDRVCSMPIGKYLSGVS